MFLICWILLVWVDDIRHPRELAVQGWFLLVTSIIGDFAMVMAILTHHPTAIC